ncbi:hypothetical protein J1605_007886 [Eschrichtius robustus]|uniref:C2H2-type domain-containing protein n=1 Tax=Eschrichtius robustus TaxID=9764 RepID=A0AB34GZI9_ESCRO|nr:hypothetical protein J1605_011426 [Eschrichtius robustus]KAJ8784859.1 hypothetical protein J1605_007886 [Eschrichtius robustus]
MAEDISYLPKGKVADTNVTRQALRGSKAAVNRRSADAPPAPLPCTSSSPWVLEQILCLQQLRRLWLCSAGKREARVCPLDTLKPAKLPHTSIPSAASSVSPGLTPFALKPDGTQDEVLYKHKSTYCSKVLGTDSSLQIHLCSHTGERPFVCSVCGHRFTTKGNLMVHFHQHPQVKANPQLFAEFHDKMTAGSGLPYALSGPVSVDESL